MDDSVTVSDTTPRDIPYPSGFFLTSLGVLPAITYFAFAFSDSASRQG